MLLNQLSYKTSTKQNPNIEVSSGIPALLGPKTCEIHWNGNMFKFKQMNAKTASDRRGLPPALLMPRYALLERAGLYE